MKKCLLCLGLGLICHLRMNGQYYFYDANHLEPRWRWEAGVSVGLMNCLTDLGGQKGNGKKFIKDVNWGASHVCSDFFVQVMHQDIIGFRMECGWGSVTACDSILKNDQSVAALRYQRNLHFQSTIAECKFLVEWHPLTMTQAEVPLLSPYLMIGLGCFHFEPKAYLENTWISLKPMHTEGQGFTEYPGRNEYRLTEIEFPCGIGLKYEFSRWAMIRIEFLYRLLTTDYLDDVSTSYIDPSLFYKYMSPRDAITAASLADRTGEIDSFHQTAPGAIRGNPHNNDAFFSFNLKLSVVLNRKRI